MLTRFTPHSKSHKRAHAASRPRPVPDPNDSEDARRDLVLTGVQKAIEEGRALLHAEMGKITGGMSMPSGLGF